MTTPAGRVVVIDDEEAIRNYLAEVLTLEGYECKCFPESLAALAYLSQAEIPPDLVMTDIRMPGMDGLELLKRVHALVPELPVILISGVYELAVALEAVEAGAADYLFKPAKPAEVLSIVARHIRTASDAELAEVQAALARFLSQYEPLSRNSAASPEQLGHSMKLFQALGSKRYETMQHSTRVTAYSTLFGEAAGLSEADLQNLQLGALLHDIGKVAIPRNVLLKPGPLNEREWAVMRTHPRIGYQLLAPLPNMKEAAEIVYAHHERYDGNGYPRRLQGADIPLAARMFSIVDTVDAITCNRPYRAAREFEAAAAELQRCRGAQFDPSLVDLFSTLPQEELVGIRDRFPDAE
jgi:putative nucleotidyltransferase with HDIG domain